MRAVTSAVAVLAVLSLVALAGARDADAGVVPNTYTVDTTVDDPNLSTCSLNPGDCSLRAAINRSNADNIAGTLIRFAMGTAGVKTITVSGAQGPLPAITGPVTIDGTTQICSIAATHPPCIIVSGAAVGHADGLVVQSTGVNIKGLAIILFDDGPRAGILFGTGAAGSVTRSFLGTADGVTSEGNGNGVLTAEGVGAVIIGGPAAKDRNVISGNTFSDVELDSPATVQNNLIGTNFTGTAAISGTQSQAGIAITAGSNGTVIGNVVSGHRDVAVLAFGEGHHIESNLIGTDVTGTSAIVNGVGVLLEGSNHVLGGDQPGQGNVISGSGPTSIHQVGRGVVVGGGGPMVIEGNLIGTNIAGDAALPNDVGIHVDQNGGTIIGGESGGARNVISGNNQEGILVDGSFNIVISGNYIGTDSSGSAAIPNSTGITVGDGSAHTTIGGASAGARNVISGNNPLNGIFVTGASTVISGNFIGTDAGGDTAVPNGGGIALLNATDAVVGGDSAAERNVVAGGSAYGISLLSVSGAVISGNYVGVDSAGSVALPNGDGIVLSRSSSNQIVGNVASGNIGAGIRVQTVAGNPSLDNNLTDNIIGLSAAGSFAVPNGGAGIQITNADGGAATGNTISQNSIDGNGGLGIDIQSTDPIPDPPELTAAETGGTTHVTGTLSSFANQTFTLEFFASPACDGSGNGEGRAFLAAKDVHTNGSGDATINVNVPQAPAGQVITATATDEDGSTSEFSNCVTVTGPTPTPTPSPSPTPNGGVQGDANCNGQMDSGDVIAALSEFVGVPPGTACPDTADADCDGDVDPDDALRITRFLADAPLQQPGQCPQIGTQT